MRTCFQLNHKENVSMKYHLKYDIFSQENVFEYAVWNGNHLVATEMRFNEYIQCWLKGFNKGERNIHGILMSHHWSVYCINFVFHGSVNTSTKKNRDKFVSIGKWCTFYQIWREFSMSPLCNNMLQMAEIVTKDSFESISHCIHKVHQSYQTRQ